MVGDRDDVIVFVVVGGLGDWVIYNNVRLLFILRHCHLQFIIASPPLQSSVDLQSCPSWVFTRQPLTSEGPSARLLSIVFLVVVYSSHRFLISRTIQSFSVKYLQASIPVAARSKASVCRRSLAGIAGSSPVDVKDLCL